VEGVSLPAPETFEEAVALVVEEIATMLIRKRRDYGALNIAGFPLGADVFLAAQAWNKTTRILNLMERKGEPANEPLADSWRDLAGYAVLALLLQRGWLLSSREEACEP